MIRCVVCFCILVICSAEAQTGLDQPALDSLIAACSDSHSANYALWLDGKPVLSRTDSTTAPLLPCYSVLKSVASLAVGRLMTDGLIRSIDEPVYTFYPEWKQGYRKLITIRHLLNHTSGIESRESTTEDWTEAPDLVQVALCTDLVSPPGEYFNYNNKALFLLLDLIGRASGMRPDKYIGEKIFAPLGITNYRWDYDDKGNTKGLLTTSQELVKIGQLVLDKGMWEGERIISEEWIDLSLQPGQPYVANCGLLWWIIPERTDYIVDDTFIDELRGAGIEETLIDKFELLRGRYTEVNIPEDKLAEVFGKDWAEYLEREFYPYFPARSRREYSPEVIGYKAEGWLGQYIVIYPEKRLVAARMVEYSEDYTSSTDEMREFEKYVRRVVE